MNTNTQVTPLNQPAQSRLHQAIVLTGVAIVCLAYTHPAAAQALAPVTRTSGIIKDTVLAITLGLMTVGFGVAGYKMMFEGATVRDSKGLLMGATLAGGAAAMAAAFMA
jgi:hypothetical protein